MMVHAPEKERLLWTFELERKSEIGKCLDSNNRHSTCTFMVEAYSRCRNAIVSYIL